jgi:hypothetical protein
MQCSNNLRQLGLAAHNHLDTRKHFPALRDSTTILSMVRSASTANNPDDLWDMGPPGNSMWHTYYHYGWALLLCPYMEQAATWEIFSSAIAGRNWRASIWDPDVGNAETDTNRYKRFQISGLHCPSDPEVRAGGSTEAGRNSYRGNMGDLYGDSGSDQWRGTIVPGSWNNGRTERPLGLQAISDGTSNTLLFSEGCITQPDASSGMRIKGGIARQDGNYGGISVWAAPMDCFNRRGPNGTLRGNTGTGVTDANDKAPFRMLPGITWCNGAYIASGFHATLPPNAPTCIEFPANIWWNGGYIGTASSHHTGGVNVLLSDASGQFVPETVDCGNLNQWGRYLQENNSARSPYNVWGGLGSRSGSESVSL